MSEFSYHSGVLHAEGVSLADIAGVVGTPFYCYSTAGLQHGYRALRDALEEFDPLICFAVKANSNQAVIRTFGDLGAGADVVSEGELRRALAAGIPPDRIIFSGVGKTADEMRAALALGIHQINVESVPELELLSEIAVDAGQVADVALRVNPDVDANTHEKITTGKKENKFGIDLDSAPGTFARAAALPGVNPVSVAVHIGSQLTDLAPFRAAFARVADLADSLRAQGIGIEHLDLGGGLGTPYDDETPPPVDAYAAAVRETVGGRGYRLSFEPGRLLAGNAGIMVSRVIYVKDGQDRRFIILDAAMNDLIRPAMYGAHHHIQPVVEPAPDAVLGAADVVGPVCESGDTFARQRDLPPLVTGDLVAFKSAGAYGAVMASTYNSRPLVAEIMVNGDRWAVVRPRQSLEALLGQDRLADWQAQADDAGPAMRAAT